MRVTHCWYIDILELKLLVKGGLMSRWGESKNSKCRIVAVSLSLKFLQMQAPHIRHPWRS